MDKSEVRIEIKDGFNVDVTGTIGSTNPMDIWETKDKWVQRAKDSRKEWDKMSQEQRDALVDLVQSSIERMHDRAEEWIPEGLIVEGGNYLDVHIRFILTDIDKKIERQQEATSFAIKRAKASLQETLQGLEQQNENPKTTED